MDQIDILTKIALDLTSALDAKSRYLRLLEGLRRAIPYDAAALLRVEKDVLSVKAAVGLSEDTMGRRFHRQRSSAAGHDLPFSGADYFPK